MILWEAIIVRWKLKLSFNLKFKIIYLMSEFKVHGKFYRELIFWIGILATICYRIIIFLNYLPNKFWTDLAWYTGTIGFAWYFAHRYLVEKHRTETIVDNSLVAKITKGDKLAKADQEILVATLNSLQSSKSQWNYIVIFLASGLALMADIVIRLLK